MFKVLVSRDYDSESKDITIQTFRKHPEISYITVSHSNRNGWDSTATSITIEELRQIIQDLNEVLEQSERWIELDKED